MDKSPTISNKKWPYNQYYLGVVDEERRKNGIGENHWSGAESLEWYIGKFLRDTMHGEGDYRWRYKDTEEVSFSYEGQFYGNRMHGYGVMSYPDGVIFDGLFYNNVRWGPGIETHACLQENVGLWRGKQLIRLTWRPETPNVTLDLNTGPDIRAQVEPHRTLLTTRVQTIGENNSAIELLNQSGAEPLAATEIWSKIYPKHCTDLASQVCHTDVFDREYYKDQKIFELEVIETMANPKKVENINKEENNIQNLVTFYAWNNNDTVIDIMKHCFKHDNQRKHSRIDLTSIINGPRSQFKIPAKHELDCRTLIMASFLGYISTVVQMVNLNNVHPDVADILGNTALMYATCGDHADIVHFLVEAGANVNDYNDSCCTPLGLALILYACRSKDIAPAEMVHALIPPPFIPPHPTSIEDKPSEWYITRDLTIQNVSNQLANTASKSLTKTVASKKRTSLSDEGSVTKKKNYATSATDIPVTKRKTTKPTGTEKDEEKKVDDEVTMVSEEKRVYNDMNTEFMIRVTDLFSTTNEVKPIPYLFGINDMTKNVETAGEEEHKKALDKNTKKNNSKVIKDPIKPSKDVIWQGSDDKDASSIDSTERKKMELLNKNMSTITQLLRDGADPQKVTCPQPALWIAIVAGSPDLVQLLVRYGADINESFPKGHNYTALDVAISQPLTYENLELIRAILKCGAKTDHILVHGEQNTESIEITKASGPTLLHSVLLRKTHNQKEEEVRQELIELLLKYNCSALTQFNGHSALEMAMMKNMDLFEIFIKSPKVDLNAPINERNQSVLIKMFTLQFCNVIPVTERLQALTNMLLYGADPLFDCQDGEDKYTNIFVYAKQNISKMENYKQTSPQGSSKPDTKGKKPKDKSKKEVNLPSKAQKEKLDHNDLIDYKQALDLVRECARILHVRWIQAKLLKDLIKIIEKYEHRQWNMILPEYNNKKACGLWLTHPRSLEIWDILQSTRKKTHKDRRILKHLLCIVYFCSNRSKSNLKSRLTAEEKGLIETDVQCILHEHKIAAYMSTESAHWTRPYVTPELVVNANSKFQVCFDCALPFAESKILCTFCKQVSFCSFECMKLNIGRVGCHPCSESLKIKYFPDPIENVSQSSML